MDDSRTKDLGRAIFGGHVPLDRMADPTRRREEMPRPQAAATETRTAPLTPPSLADRVDAALRAELRAFNPDEPRGPDGKFGSGGRVSDAAKARQESEKNAIAEADHTTFNGQRPPSREAAAAGQDYKAAYKAIAGASDKGAAQAAAARAADAAATLHERAAALHDKAGNVESAQFHRNEALGLRSMAKAHDEQAEKAGRGRFSGAEPPDEPSVEMDDRDEDGTPTGTATARVYFPNATADDLNGSLRSRSMGEQGHPIDGSALHKALGSVAKNHGMVGAFAPHAYQFDIDGVEDNHDKDEGGSFAKVSWPVRENAPPQPRWRPPRGAPTEGD